MVDVPRVELSMQDLRVVAGFAAECAEEALVIFEEHRPDDPRPRAALEAARAFADGADRTQLLRTTALAAHAAAREANSGAAREAARAAGQAAAAAFLHPLAQATQVRHILGAAAHAARAAELLAGGDESVGTRAIERASRRANVPLIDVLRRYPRAASSGNRVTRLMSDLDSLLRG